MYFLAVGNVYNTEEEAILAIEEEKSKFDRYVLSGNGTLFVSKDRSKWTSAVRFNSDFERLDSLEFDLTSLPESVKPSFFTKLVKGAFYTDGNDSNGDTVIVGYSGQGFRVMYGVQTSQGTEIFANKEEALVHEIKDFTQEVTRYVCESNAEILYVVVDEGECTKVGYAVQVLQTLFGNRLREDYSDKWGICHEVSGKSALNVDLLDDNGNPLDLRVCKSVTRDKVFDKKALEDSIIICENQTNGVSVKLLIIRD